jgi:hypothetical protein
MCNMHSLLHFYIQVADFTKKIATDYGCPLYTEGDNAGVPLHCCVYHQPVCISLEVRVGSSKEFRV